jgi:SAM-dependent methyltransferase
VTGTTDITALVRGLYTKYPYPHYPLFASLKWGDGYLASSSVAAHICGVERRPAERILLAGSGEALPYIIRKWEPASRALSCVDLSSSSLWRARFRLLADPRPASFYCEDLTTFLPKFSRTFSHVDSIGVLHHLEKPSHLIRLLAQSMRPGATARVMVYNTIARRWINDLSKSFRLLKLDPYVAGDLATARRILQLLSAKSPLLSEKLRGMGPSILSNDTRLVDTFFHFREVKFTAEAWYRAFEREGFHVEGLFDRYAELDDLPNPLWQAPSGNELDRRSSQALFENNLELFLSFRKNDIKGTKSERATYPLHRLYCLSRRWPRYWFDYEETRNVPVNLRLVLWYRYLTHLFVKPAPIDDISSRFRIDALKRLARLGAILPTQVSSVTLKKRLAEPMGPVAGDVAAERTVVYMREDSELAALVESRLAEKSVFSERRFAQVFRRWNQASNN